MTPEMLSLQWINLAMYPAGHFARRIQIEPSVRFPEGWTPFSALETTGGRGRRHPLQGRRLRHPGRLAR